MLSNKIITFTPNAIQHIEKKIAEQNALGFRLSIKKTGCSGYAYVPDIIHQKKENDIELTFNTVSIFVDSDSAQYLAGTVVDFVDSGLGQTRMVFNNPNAANLCGCGESFNLAEE